jgi:hypothetical protein
MEGVMAIHGNGKLAQVAGRAREGLEAILGVTERANATPKALEGALKFLGGKAGG